MQSDESLANAVEITAALNVLRRSIRQLPGDTTEQVDDLGAACETIGDVIDYLILYCERRQET